jgi:hypothetical protein
MGQVEAPPRVIAKDLIRRAVAKVGQDAPEGLGRSHAPFHATTGEEANVIRALRRYETGAAPKRELIAALVAWVDAWAIQARRALRRRGVQ